MNGRGEALALACAAALLASLTALTAARADSGWVHLEWQRPPASTCPPAAVIERDVAQMLGRDVFTSARGARLQLFGAIKEHPFGVAVQLQARDLRGELLGSRELHGEPGACAALQDEISLVLMLLVERVDSATPAKDTVQLGIGFGGALLVNALPREAIGMGPTFTLDISGALQLRADVAYWLPFEMRTTRDIHANLQAVSLALRACPRLLGQELSSWTVHVCAGVQLLTLVAAQSRPERHDTQLQLRMQGLVELRGALRLVGTTRLELAAGPVIALQRTGIFSVASDGERAVVFRPALLGLMLSLSLVI